MSAVDPFGLLYAISFPSGDHDAPIVVSDAAVFARRTIPLPSGLTSTRSLFSLLKTMRPLILPGNADRPAWEPIAVEPASTASVVATPSSARALMTPPWMRIGMSSRPRPPQRLQARRPRCRSAGSRWHRRAGQPGPRQEG